MIISVGYRVNSKRGILFKKWATKILKDYMLKGKLTTSEEIEKFKWYTSKDGTDILSNTLKNEVIPYCLKNSLID